MIYMNLINFQIWRWREKSEQDTLSLRNMLLNIYQKSINHSINRILFSIFW